MSFYAAEDLRDKVAGAVQLLQSPAGATVSDGPDEDACFAFLSQVLLPYRPYAALMSIRPDGQMFCASMRNGRALNLSDQAYFMQASGPTEPVVEL